MIGSECLCQQQSDSRCFEQHYCKSVTKLLIKPPFNGMNGVLKCRSATRHCMKLACGNVLGLNCCTQRGLLQTHHLSRRQCFGTGGFTAKAATSRLSFPQHPPTALLAEWAVDAVSMAMSFLVLRWGSHGDAGVLCSPLVCANAAHMLVWHPDPLTHVFRENGEK